MQKKGALISAYNDFVATSRKRLVGKEDPAEA